MKYFVVFVAVVLAVAVVDVAVANIGNCKTVHDVEQCADKCQKSDVKDLAKCILQCCEKKKLVAHAPTLIDQPLN